MASMTLTDDQLCVIKSQNSHLVVLAGPGSGKTHTIIAKIIHLFESNFIPEPYGLLAITFTNAAANEMRSRLRRSGFSYWSRIWIGTFHSFGYYLLSCYGGDVGIREDFDLIERHDQIKLCNQIIKSVRLGNISADNLLRAIEDRKRQGVYPDQENAPIDKSLRDAYTAYQQFLCERNLLDFGDLVALSLRLLQTSELPRRLFTNYFRYIIVDEFQDTDLQQLELTCLLAKAALGSTMVADDDQSIYRFRGANRANVYKIEELLGAERVILGANFRSDRIIVEAAQAIITREADRKPKNVNAVSDKRGYLYKAGFDSPEEEASQVVKWIYGLHNQKLIEDWGQAAIITRNHWRSEQVLKAMDLVQVPWFDRGRLNFQDSWETSLGLAILGLAFDLNSSNELHRVMTEIENGGLAAYMEDDDALDTARWIRNQLLKDMTFTAIPANAPRILEIAKMKDIIHRFSWSATDEKRLIKNLEIMVLDVMQEAQMFGLNLVQVVNRLAGYGAVQVMSGHGSKGKEFDHVFLVGLEDDVLPSYRAHNKREEIDEERRIFYVGLTRARKAAYLTYATKREMPWGGIQSKIPSRFIGHIPEELFDKTLLM